MNNEPKAGAGLDPEMLAAYIDKRLSPEQRAAVEEQLATDPDSYAVLVETLKALDHQDTARAPEVHVLSRRRLWAIAAVGLAAAAALAIVVAQPTWLQQMSDGGHGSEMARLVTAVGHERYFEARVTGGFDYRPVRVTRGAPAENLPLAAAASELIRRAESNPLGSNRHAAAVALLLLGDYEAAIRMLESIGGDEKDAAMWSDLAAAYVTMAQRTGNVAHAANAVKSAAAALVINPDLNEARFNMALATELTGSAREAVVAWTDYLTREPSEDWRREATARLDRLDRQR